MRMYNVYMSACMSVFVCVCACTSVMGQVWRSKDNLGFHISFHLFDTACHNHHLSCLADPWASGFSPVSTFHPYLGLHTDECHHSQLCVNCFNQWAIFPRSISFIHSLVFFWTFCCAWNIVLECISCWTNFIHIASKQFFPKNCHI